MTSLSPDRTAIVTGAASVRGIGHGAFLVGDGTVLISGQTLIVDGGLYLH